jgi:hypothetical protein
MTPGVYIDEECPFAISKTNRDTDLEFLFDPKSLERWPSNAVGLPVYSNPTSRAGFFFAIRSISDW